MNKLGVGYLSYGFLAQKAEDFLLRYNPSGLIPIPIEEIVEFKLKVDIVPVPNLQKDFDIEGFTSSDLQNIFVDDYILSERPTRYRFTLAHEVGHIILHKEIFTKVKINSTKSWISFHENLDDWERSALEFQGYAFGGLILVPPKDLKKSLLENLREVNPLIKICRTRKIPRSEYLKYAKELLASKLVPIFDVSMDVISRRIEYDKLGKFFP
jgi:Zn-dependent peptidase ImmA (M78 family)